MCIAYVIKTTNYCYKKVNNTQINGELYPIIVLEIRYVYNIDSY